MILKIKIQDFFFFFLLKKKKTSPHAHSACDEASYFIMRLNSVRI